MSLGIEVFSFFDISLLEAGLTGLTAELWGRQAVFLSNGSIDKRNLNSVDSKQEKQNGSCKNVHFSNKDMNSNNNNSSAALSRFFFLKHFHSQFFILPCEDKKHAAKYWNISSLKGTLEEQYGFASFQKWLKLHTYMKCYLLYSISRLSWWLQESKKALYFFIQIFFLI